MAGRISDFQAHEWLNSLGVLWLSLHHENPEVGGAYASELMGGGYARQKMAFTRPSARAIFSEEIVTWSGLPSLMVSYVGAWNKSHRGDLVAFFEIPTPVFVPAGGSISFAAGDIALSLD